MNIDSIQYQKTIERNKLIYKRMNLDRFFGMLSVIVPTGLLLFFFSHSFPEILKHDPEEMDYFMAFLLPAVTIVFGLYFIWKVFNRNRLKEIVYSTEFEKANAMIFETAEKINWKLLEKTENVITFKTDRDSLTYRQDITIIITPNKKILFNSSPGKDFRDVSGLQTIISYYPTRFFDNHTKFQATFRRLEKIKTAANNGYPKMAF